ncbi:hypothetical protein WDW86_21565 [Bdellovibrionota bacterium FG-2]
MKAGFVPIFVTLLGTILAGCAETQHVVRLSPMSLPEFDRELSRIGEPEVTVSTVFLKELIRKQKKQNAQYRDLLSKLKAIKSIDQEAGSALR